MLALLLANLRHRAGWMMGLDGAMFADYATLTRGNVRAVNACSTHRIGGLVAAILLLAPALVHADEADPLRYRKDPAASMTPQEHAAAATVLEATVKNAEAFGANDLRLAAALCNLGRARRMLHDYAPAEASYLRALGILDRAPNDSDPLTAEVLHGLGEVSQLQGRFDDAENYYELEVALLEKISGPEHPSVALALSNNLAAIYRFQSRNDEVDATYRRALAILEKSVAPADSRLGFALIDLAEWSKRMQRYSQAEAYYRRGIPIIQASLPLSHARMLSGLQDWGLVNQFQGHYNIAESIYRRLLGIVESSFGRRHPSVGTVLGNLVGLYETQGREAEAAVLRKRMFEVGATRYGRKPPAPYPERRR